MDITKAGRQAPRTLAVVAASASTGRNKVSIGTSGGDVISEARPAEHVEETQARQPVQPDHAIRIDDPHDLQTATAPLSDLAEFIRDFNASNEANEDLWTRVHQAGDAVRRSAEDRDAAQQHARQARDFRLAIQAEYPHRRAPLLRQALIAVFTVALNALACWFAAQALGEGQTETLLWTVLFLAVLACGEVALDHFSERGARAWRLLASGLVIFVTGLGVLRFLYLATVGGTGLGTALVGAGLFTAATLGFLAIGYRALRAAEKFPAWQARRRSRRAERAAVAASHQLARLIREHDRLIEAYVSRSRVGLLERCSADQLPELEAALRQHLTGRDPA
jgi:hypothetical protein